MSKHVGLKQKLVWVSVLVAFNIGCSTQNQVMPAVTSGVVPSVDFGDKTVQSSIPSRAPADEPPSGGGTWTPPSPYTTGTDYPISGVGRASILADINSDGKVDIISTEDNSYSETPSKVAIWAGNGSGSFSLMSRIDGGYQPRDIIAEDLNRDGILDLAVADDRGYVTILLGSGKGLFLPGRSEYVSGFLWRLASGDFNRDGVLDLAATGDSPYANVLLGDGSGAFPTKIQLEVGESPNEIAIADLNRDGKLDLITTIAFRIGGVSFRFGDGNGGFGSPTVIPTTDHPNTYGAGSLSVVDLNRDGKPDIIAGNSTLLGNGDGTFLPKQDLSREYHYTRPVDVNKDGKLDLIASYYFVDSSYHGSDGFSILLGDGLGHFAPPLDIHTGNSVYSCSFGDVNVDGKVDMLTLSFSNVTMYLHQ